MDKRHYQVMQYILIAFFIAFYVYIVTYRCEPTIQGALLCGPKVLGVSVWFVASLLLLKITHMKIKKGSDAAQITLFWLSSLIIVGLQVAAFIMLFVYNYI